MEENYVRYKFEGAIQIELFGDGHCIVPPEAEGRWEKVSEGKYEISVNGESSYFYVDVTESGVEAYMYIDNMKVFFTNDLENYVYPENVYY